MPEIFYIFIFIASCFIFFWAGSFLIGSLLKIARYLGWREFIVAFIIAFAASAPNLLVGINSALRGIPELSFGDVVGGNIVDLTLAVALAVLVGKTILPAESRLIQVSTIFTAITAVLPLILILDGTLGRGDGIILLLIFAFYIFWLFSKEERFKKIYDDDDGQEPIKEFKVFLKSLGRILLALFFLILASEGVIRSAVFFADSLGIALPIVGILIVGLGNALPEIYFSIVSAKKGETWMVLGNLMGAIIIPATLVLGIVALIQPIKIIDFSPFVVARAFLLISAIFFFIIIKSGQKVTKKEAIFLLGIYIAFVVSGILLK